MPPAVERIKMYSNKVNVERAEERAAKAEKSGSEKMRERVELHEAAPAASGRKTARNSRVNELCAEGQVEKGLRALNCVLETFPEHITFTAISGKQICSTRFPS